jgi:hypothetical protein
MRRVELEREAQPLELRVQLGARAITRARSEICRVGTGTALAV